MSAKHEKDYEYPLQINGRRVGNTTRLVDWMAQRWFIDGGFQVIAPDKPSTLPDTIHKFMNRMFLEHNIVVSYTRKKMEEGRLVFEPDLPVLVIERPNNSHPIGDNESLSYTCRNPFHQHIRSPHD